MPAIGTVCKLTERIRRCRATTYWEEFRRSPVELQAGIVLPGQIRSTPAAAPTATTAPSSAPARHFRVAMRRFSSATCASVDELPRASRWCFAEKAFTSPRNKFLAGLIAAAPALRRRRSAWAACPTTLAKELRGPRAIASFVDLSHDPSPSQHRSSTSPSPGDSVEVLARATFADNGCNTSYGRRRARPPSRPASPRLEPCSKREALRPCPPATKR